MMLVFPRVRFGTQNMKVYSILFCSYSCALKSTKLAKFRVWIFKHISLKLCGNTISLQLKLLVWWITFRWKILIFSENLIRLKYYFKAFFGPKLLTSIFSRKYSCWLYKNHMKNSCNSWKLKFALFSIWPIDHELYGS